MYNEEILDHAKSPQNIKPLNIFSIEEKSGNPSCGDMVTIQLFIENNIIKNIQMLVHGCAISRASGSILSEYVKGKDLFELKDFSYNHLEKLLNISLSFNRMKCADLPRETLENAIKKYVTMHL